VSLTVLRDNREQKIRAKLGEFNSETARAAEEKDAGPNNQSGSSLGVTVEPLTPDIAQQLNLKSGTQGVVVDAVDPAGPAVAAGLQRGDVIQEVNRAAVRSAADLKAALDKTETSRPCCWSIVAARPFIWR